MTNKGSASTNDAKNSTNQSNDEAYNRQKTYHKLSNMLYKKSKLESSIVNQSVVHNSIPSLNENKSQVSNRNFTNVYSIKLNLSHRNI